MKDKISVMFGKSAAANLRASINGQELFCGTVQDLDLIFNLQDTNRLELTFSFVDSADPIDIKEVFYNNLSIEHFIYQGVFIDELAQKISPLTHIKQNGRWYYEFSKDLAREIIKANT